MGGRSRRVVRVAVSVGLLAAVFFFVDVGEVMQRLSRLDVRWVVVGLLLSVIQVVLSAWRWRYTAARLDVALPLGVAVREYYLATFLNQVLPGGVIGDVSRAWRHTGVLASGGEESTTSNEGSGVADEPGADGDSVGTKKKAPAVRAVHAVVLERVSGQVVMIGAALVSGFVLLVAAAVSPGEEAAAAGGAGLPPGSGLAGGASGGGISAGALIVAALVVAAAVFAVVRIRRLPAWVALEADARRALLGRALPVQAVLSLLIVASYVVVFLFGARAVGVTTSWALLAPLVPPILVAMLLPVSVAGWGLREGAAAALWGVVGLQPAEGVAVSVVYGLLVLVSSLPGAAVPLLTTAGGARGRREGRRPDGSDGRAEDAAPGRANRSGGD